MQEPNWQLSRPLDAIIFDCDGTLSKIEGIDELARVNGKREMIAKMTQKAMSETGLNPTVYQERLALIQPTLQQVKQLAADYFETRTAYAQEVISILTRLNKAIYIMSAGLAPAVKTFGKQLNILEENIFAVDVLFDQEGKYQSFDHNSPLIYNHGKQKFIHLLKQKYNQLAHIGDGLNDLVAKELVTRFIGFGGFYYRENIAQAAHFYIKEPSLLGLLPLILTVAEIKQLSKNELELFELGFSELNLNATPVT